MFILLILFIFILAALIATKRKSAGTLLFSLIIVSIMLVLFASVLYVVKLTHVKYYSEYEWGIHSVFKNIKISYYDISDYVNFANLLFLVSMFGFLLASFSKRSKGFWVVLTISVVVLAAFYCVNRQETYESLYIMKHTMQSKSQITQYKVLSTFVVLFNVFLLYGLCLIVDMRLLFSYFRSQLFFRKRYLLSVSIILVFVQTVYLFLIRAGVLSGYFNNFNVMEFNVISDAFMTKMYIYIPCIMIMFFTILFILILKYNLLNEVNFARKKTVAKKAKLGMTDVRHFLHTYKNMLMIIAALCEGALKDYGTENGREQLEKIKTNSNDFMLNISRMLNVYNKPILQLDVVNMADCTAEAVTKLKNSYNTPVKLNYEKESLLVYGDSERLTEMLYNVLLNAAEAIESCQRANGVIAVNGFIEMNWVCIEIKDNGCGMDKKTLKSLFNPLKTTRKTFKNWGIGMSYVQNTADAHLGFVDVRSIVNQGTQVQIILPIER